MGVPRGITGCLLIAPLVREITGAGISRHISIFNVPNGSRGRDLNTIMVAASHLAPLCPTFGAKEDQSIPRNPLTQCGGSLFIRINSSVDKPSA